MSSPAHPIKIRQIRGVVLPSVMWIALLSMVVAVNYASAVQLNIRATDNIQQSMLARHDAISGIYIGIERLLSNPANGDTGLQLKINDNSVTVEISRESLKTNLNSASDDELHDAFVEAGIETELARLLAARVADWRDSDHSTRSNGREDADYFASGKPYGARDLPFGDLVELLQIANIDTRLYSRLGKYFTVYPAYASGRYTLTARVRNAEGNQAFVTSAVVQLGNNRRTPYRIIKWQHHNG